MKFPHDNSMKYVFILFRRAGKLQWNIKLCAMMRGLKTKTTSQLAMIHTLYVVSLINRRQTSSSTDRIPNTTDVTSTSEKTVSQISVASSSNSIKIVKLRFAARRVERRASLRGLWAKRSECPPGRAYKSRENMHSDTDVMVFVWKLLLNFYWLIKNNFWTMFLKL